MQGINRITEALASSLLSNRSELQMRPPDTLTSTEPLSDSAQDSRCAAPARWGNVDAEKVLRRFWDRMAMIYGHRWSTSYGADARTAGQDWGEALASLTLDQIKRGIDACRDGHGPGDGWPPTLPQFRELCLAIPKLSEVRREIDSRDGQRTAFGLLVAQRMDLWAYRRAEDAFTADRLVKDAYAEARAHVLAGGELPPVLAALPDETDREPKPADPELAARVLAEMRAIWGEVT